MVVLLCQAAEKAPDFGPFSWFARQTKHRRLAVNRVIQGGRF
jgi:hypothetical protein